MASVRWERMNRFRNERTYQAIECENAREAMARQSTSAPVVRETPVEQPDTRDPIEMARSAAAALRGSRARR
jgi:hypothetical protein